MPRTERTRNRPSSSTASTGSTTPLGVTTTLGPLVPAVANDARPSGGRTVLVGAMLVGATLGGGAIVVVLASGTDGDVDASLPRSDTRSAGDGNDCSVVCDAHDAASAMINSADPRNVTQARP